MKYLVIIIFAAIVTMIFSQSLFAGSQILTKRISEYSPGLYLNTKKMDTALIFYQYLAKKGGWTPIPTGPILKKGDYGERILALRNRLHLSGDLAANESVDQHFDQALEKAVQRFQYRHGLKTDGIVGAETLQTLNIPVEKLVKQLQLNLARMEELIPQLEQRHLLINLPDYRLQLIEKGRLLAEMRVIIGKKSTPTPVLGSKIFYLVVNPYWKIPTSIVVNEIIPLLDHNPAYLEQQNIKVYDGWGAEANELDPASISWTELDLNTFNYMLRQEPGPGNQLGSIKFIFPNQYHVYLHDTPAQSLFQRKKRALSAGCIRLEKPFELALSLLTDDPVWTAEHLFATITEEKNWKVEFKKPIAVYLVYWTAWVNHYDQVHFRDDIYRIDQRELNPAAN